MQQQLSTPLRNNAGQRSANLGIALISFHLQPLAEPANGSQGQQSSGVITGDNANQHLAVLSHKDTLQVCFQ